MKIDCRRECVEVKGKLYEYERIWRPMRDKVLMDMGETFVLIDGDVIEFKMRDRVLDVFVNWYGNVCVKTPIRFIDLSLLES